MNEIKVTGDGSKTLFNSHFREHYHSTYGAITESKHVFINNGLHYLTKDPVTIFEIGFGTGLNAYLACLDAQQQKRTIAYYAIEKYPLENNIIAQLNYPALLASKESDKLIFNHLHNANWEKQIAVTAFFTLYKINRDLTSFNPDFYYDLVFFDAFAPDRQPEMWTPDVFRRLYNKLNPDGILTTFCVKGHIKRILKEAGFTIEKLPGPPGKREMLRAVR